MMRQNSLVNESLGDNVNESLGDNVNESLGDNVNESLGDNVNESLGDNVNESLGDNVNESLGDNVNESLGDNVNESLGDNVNEIKRLRREIEEIKEKERVRLGDDFLTMMLWARKREKIEPLDDTFYAFEDAWKKACAMITPLRPYIDHLIYKDVLFSASLHYIICEPFEFYTGDNEDVLKTNPLFQKYDVASKAYIISSASDESSSSSIHTTKSLNEGDFIMQDLLRTRYGTWVYSILEQLNIGVTLL